MGRGGHCVGVESREREWVVVVVGEREYEY